MDILGRDIEKRHQREHPQSHEGPGPTKKQNKDLRHSGEKYIPGEVWHSLRILVPRKCRRPPPFSAKWLPFPLKDISNTHNTVTHQEVQTAIRSSKSKSTPGPDGITYQMIAYANQANPDILPDLFSNLLHYGVFPDKWKIAKCVAITEAGGSDGSNPKNHLPILLLLCLGKTFEKSWHRELPLWETP